MENKFKRTIRVTKVEDQEVDVFPFFKRGCFYYMTKENGRYTQVSMGIGVEKEYTLISDVTENTAFCGNEQTIQITEEEFFAKFEEAVHELSISSREVTLKEAVENNNSQAAAWIDQETDVHNH